MSGASRIAQNVAPSAQGYRPFPQFERYGDNIAGAPRGAFSCISAVGTIYNFVGTATRLYRAATDGLSWLNATRTAGGDYTTPPGGFWTFSQFGDLVTAQNGFDTPQTFTLDVSTNFINDANIPVAQFSGTVRGFSVAARLLTDNHALAWSGIYSPTDFVPSDITMSDQQYMPDGGEIMGFVGGEIGVLFQRRAIQRMVFAGPPLTFGFDKISNTLGCRASGSIAAYGDLIFFLAENGVHMIRSGQEIVPIGEGKIDLWFAANVNKEFYNNISSAINPVGKTYIMGFPTMASADGTPDKLLVYHWPTGKWSLIDREHLWLYTAIAQTGYNLDTIDDLNPNPPNTTGIDGMNFSFDAAIFSGPGILNLSMFDKARYNGFFNGPPMRAQVETGAIQLVPGRKSLLLGVRPMAEGDYDDISAYDAVADRLQDSFVTTSGQNNVRVANSRGIVPMRSSGRYHRLGVIIGADAGRWTTMLGVDDLDVKPQSK
jgi:hypothetical protein